MELYHAMVSTYKKKKVHKKWRGQERRWRNLGEMRGSSGDNHKKNI